MKEALGCDLFSRVGACGRRPSESADPGGPASWVLLKKRYRVKQRKKLYGGRGLGLARCTNVSILASKKGRFTTGK